MAAVHAQGAHEQRLIEQTRNMEGVCGNRLLLAEFCY